MFPARLRTILHFVFPAALLALIALPSVAASPSRLLTRELTSKNLANTRIATNPTRQLVVYLPPDYDTASHRYPVIYFLPNPLENFRSIFDTQNAQSVFDHAINSGVIRPFILVAVDMTTPFGSTWYVNSPVTGNWEDFVVRDLVPYVDANFRTLPSRDARGIAGHFMGGYGALRFGMKHPEVFGTVYAMHPVGTGSGVQIMDARPDWNLLSTAKSLDDVKKDIFSTIFTSIYQAHLPDPARPPLYIDLPAKRENGQLVIDPALTARLRDSFLLESMVAEYADNLKSLRALKFDWSRADTNWDHVYSNQAFTHKLNEFGIIHEAEEFNGTWGEPYWGPEGRVTTEVLPFFQRHLVFDSPR